MIQNHDRHLLELGLRHRSRPQHIYDLWIASTTTTSLTMKKSTPFTRSALHTASGKMPVASFNWIWKWWRGACILLFPTPLSTALASQVDMTATGKTLERVRDCKPLASSSIVTGQWCCHWHKPCRHLSFCTQRPTRTVIKPEPESHCLSLVSRMWQKQYHLSTLVLGELLSRSYWVACLSSAFPLTSEGKADNKAAIVC